MDGRILELLRVAEEKTGWVPEVIAILKDEDKYELWSKDGERLGEVHEKAVGAMDDVVLCTPGMCSVWKGGAVELILDLERGEVREPEGEE